MTDASTIYRLLANRHARDMIWFEVKDGPSRGTTHLRLDALAIAKSWRPVRVYGYEVKVSRSDWVKDQKWQEYAGYCNYLSVVAPDGIVDPKEVPDGFGLLVPARTGSMLRTVRKPARREVDPDWMMLLYLLMNRTLPDNGRHTLSRELRIQQWREALGVKYEARKIGYLVRHKTRELLDSLRSSAKRQQDLAELDAWLDVHDAGEWGSVAERLERALTRERRELRDARRQLAFRAVRCARLLRDCTEMTRGATSHEAPCRSV